MPIRPAALRSRRRWRSSSATPAARDGDVKYRFVSAGPGKIMLSYELATQGDIIAEHADGLDLVLDMGALDASSIERVRRRLTEALRVLDLRAPPTPP